MGRRICLCKESRRDVFLIGLGTDRARWLLSVSEVVEVDLIGALVQLDCHVALHVLLKRFLLCGELSEQSLELFLGASLEHVFDIVEGLHLVRDLFSPRLLPFELSVDLCDSVALTRDVFLFFTFVDDDVLI